MFDPILDFGKIPLTGGRHYSYITREEFDSYLSFLDKYTRDDLFPGDRYRIIRLAKSEENESVVYLTIDIKLISINAFEIFFVHEKDGSISGAKRMRIQDQYKQTWFFIKEHDINN